MSLACLSHKPMLQDKVRVSAYRQAIFETVKDGDVVVDLGSGTGILGFFACQAKAKRVYAIEQSDTIEWGQKLCAANGFQDRMVFIKGNSASIVLPEKADVIVSEMLGHFCLEENLTRFVVDARERLLKPGGLLVPSRAEMFIAPFEAFDAYDEHVEFWKRSIEGLDYSLVRPAATNRRYILLIPPNGILAAPICVKDLDFYSVQGDVTLDREATFVIERNGILHGIVGWFEVQLSPNVRLATGPASQPTHWKQTLFPIAERVRVVEGDSVIARVRVIDVGHIFWEWHVEVIGADRARKGRFKHSNFDFLTRKDLVFRIPSLRPELSEGGRIALSVLDWCDGKVTLQEMAGRLQRQFPEQCPTEEAAMQWVWASLKGKVEIAEKLSNVLPLEIQEAADTNLLAEYPSHHPQAISQVIDDEKLVWKLDSGKVSVLSGVGGKVWELMDGTRSLGEIVSECAEFYQTDRGQVEKDVLVFVQDLLEREMIVFNQLEGGHQ